MYRNRTYKFVQWLVAVALVALIAGCEFSNQKDQEYGPVDPGGDDTNQVTITIKLSPESASIESGQTVQFAAVVAGTSNTTVTWSVPSGPGTISQSGLYTAPASIATNAEIATVQAALSSNTSVRATALVVVSKPTSGGGGGDTARNGEICFETEIVPIFRSNCAKSGCHDNVTREKGYVFTDYAGVLRGVDPGRLENSEIYEKITEDRADKIMPPPPNNPLTTAQITTIRQWILEGARNTICPPDNNECDTLNVSFAGFVQPLLANTCVGCHSGQNPPGGIRLDSYENIRTIALSKRLYGAISHTPPFIQMPYQSPKLPDCTIQKIGAWVNAGALNN